MRCVERLFAGVYKVEDPQDRSDNIGFAGGTAHLTFFEGYCNITVIKGAKGKIHFFLNESRPVVSIDLELGDLVMADRQFDKLKYDDADEEASSTMNAGIYCFGEEWSRNPSEYVLGIPDADSFCNATMYLRGRESPFAVFLNNINFFLHINRDVEMLVIDRPLKVIVGSDEE